MEHTGGYRVQHLGNATLEVKGTDASGEQYATECLYLHGTAPIKGNPYGTDRLTLVSKWGRLYAVYSATGVLTLNDAVEVSERIEKPEEGL